MASINLYKIDAKKIKECIKKIKSSGFKPKGNKNISEAEKTYKLDFYDNVKKNQKPVSWNWILREFNLNKINATIAPKALLLVENKINDEKNLYVVTFGSAFFVIDKYCDKDFAFEFASRMKYETIKTTTLSTPNLKRNKTVNTYTNYNELDFDSGESFIKLKVQAELDKEFELFDKSLEVGNSIHFKTKEETLENIIDIILHVEEIMKKDIIYKIPLFKAVKDENILNELSKIQDSLLIDVFLNNNDSYLLSIPELEIVGSKEIFKNNDDKFGLKYLGGKIKEISELSSSKISNFCKEKKLDTADKIKKIKVIRYNNDEKIGDDKLEDIIEIIDDVKKCILFRGKWYRFNDDYLSYLNDSIAEIEIIYNEDYDFNDQIHDQYLAERYRLEKDESNYVGKTEVYIKESLKKKYYAERSFNEIRSKDSFVNYDRQINNGVEAMDLYEKDSKTMFAVKIGNSSASLCYAIDQSSTSLKMYKDGKLPITQEINSVGLWFILERKTKLPLNDKGHPDLEFLEMIMLKNRIDHWKKEVRLAGYTPRIYINYRT